MIDEKKNRNIFLLFIFIIPTLLFFIINGVIFMIYKKVEYSQENILLYFATMFGSGISAYITYITLLYTLKESEKNLEINKSEVRHKEIMENLTNAIFSLYEMKAMIHNSTYFLVKCKTNPLNNLINSENYSTKIYFLQEKVIYYTENINYNSKYRYNKPLMIHLENIKCGINKYFDDYNLDIESDSSIINPQNIPSVMSDIDIYIYDLKNLKYNYEEILN